jgi:hypothetical protein
VPVWAFRVCGISSREIHKRASPLIAEPPSSDRVNVTTRPSIPEGRGSRVGDTLARAPELPSRALIEACKGLSSVGEQRVCGSFRRAGHGISSPCHERKRVGEGITVPVFRMPHFDLRHFESRQTCIRILLGILCTARVQ